MSVASNTDLYGVMEGFRFSEADAKQIGPVLHALSQRDGGCTIESVWNEASNPESPLHAYCTWNQRKAARKCQHDECRYMARGIGLWQLCVEDEEPSIIRAFISVEVDVSSLDHLENLVSEEKR